MINTNICPVCLKDNIVIDNSASNILDLKNNINSSVYKCKNCDSMYLYPYLSSDELSKLYESSYFTGDDTSLDIPSSGADYEEDFAMDRVSKFQNTIDLLLSYKPNAKSILDIGAATGKFLSIAQRKNLEVSGVEYSAYAAEEAKDKYGFNFFVGDLQKFNSTEKFDLIHLNHVFEHLVDPHQSIEKFDSLLSENGLIYIEVPFQFNIIELVKYKLFNITNNFNIFSVHHPIFYRPQSLKNLFKEHGFSCEYIRLFDESRYPNIGLKNKVKKLIWKLLALFGQGIMIEAVFSRKKNR